MNIFDHVDFFGLINLADTNQEIRQVITEHYMIPKYGIHEKLIRFEGAGYSDHVSDDIIIGNYTTVLQFIRIFGHKLSKIQVSGDLYSADVIDKINEYIARYCTTSLTELYVINGGHGLSVGTWSIFPKVRNVHFEDLTYLDNIQIQRIFPNAKEVTILIDDNLEASKSYTQKYPKEIQNLIEAMPEIMTLHISLPSFELIPVISRNLRFLETLKIKCSTKSFKIPSNASTVHFQNVRNFQISIMDEASELSINQVPIAFDHLETLEIWTGDSRNVPLHLIEENVQLRSVLLPWIFQANALTNVLHRIEQTHDRLDEIRLLWSVRISAERTWQLINANGRVKKIVFIVVGVKDVSNFRQTLAAIISVDWRVCEANEDSNDNIAARLTTVTIVRDH